jgi:hypothetical protein
MRLCKVKMLMNPSAIPFQCFRSLTKTRLVLVSVNVENLP